MSRFVPGVASALAAIPELPAPPTSSLLWGHQPDFLADKTGFMERAARAHGDFVPLRFGPVRFWLVSDPGVIGEILGPRAPSFRKDIGLRRAKVLLGGGLLTSEGAEHDRRSRLAQPAFRHKDVEAYAPGIVELTARVAASWEDGARVDLAAEMSRLALAIVGRALFGADLLAEAASIGAAVTEALEVLEVRFNKIFPLPLWIPTAENRRFNRAKRVLDAAVYGMVRERRRTAAERAAGGHSQDAPHDLLSRLLDARVADAPALADEELRDEVMTLFLAGHETTANALAFTLRLLAENPGALAALRAELDSVLGERPAAAADLPRLPYTAAVFAEGLRLYPPAWILGREPVEDVTLGGGRLHLRRGAVVAMSPWVVQRDPRWFPDPLAFRPERFLPDAPRLVPHSYFPFGAGKRACIGRAFALLEGSLVLATVLRAVDLEIDLSRPVRTVALMTLRPGDGVQATVRRRARAAVPAA